MGIGRRLKEAREKLGITQEELGRQVGVTGSAITNYEKDTSHPKEPVMYALIDALGVEPNFLFQDCVNVLKNKKKDPKELEELKEIYCKLLNQEGRKRLMSHARYLTKEADCMVSKPPSKSKTG